VLISPFFSPKEFKVNNDEGDTAQDEERRVLLIEGLKEEEREGGREGRRNGGREGGREGGKEEWREGEREKGEQSNQP